MAKSKKQAEAVTPKKSTVDTSKENINQLKEMYADFRDTLGEIVGDTGDFAKKHKFLIILGFLFYLWNRNRTFTIDGFVKKLEDKLAQDSDWNE
jgi:hypothetical protein